MTPDLWHEDIKKPEVISELERILCNPLSEEQIERLSIAVLEFQFAALLEVTPEFNPSRAERRKTLEGLASQLETLSLSLDSPAIQIAYHEFIDQLPKSLELKEMARRARAFAAAIPRSGADPKRARADFVRSLAQVFEDVTGKQAKGPTNYENSLDAGPFYEFCSKVLAHIDPVERDPLTKRSALVGLDAVVREVVSERRPKRTAG